MTRPRIRRRFGGRASGRRPRHPSVRETALLTWSSARRPPPQRLPQAPSPWASRARRASAPAGPACTAQPAPPLGSPGRPAAQGLACWLRPFPRPSPRPFPRPFPPRSATASPSSARSLIPLLGQHAAPPPPCQVSAKATGVPRRQGDSHPQSRTPGRSVKRGFLLSPLQS